MKGRHRGVGVFWVIFGVSIHAPVKGRLFLTFPTFFSLGFNPRPREGATAATYAAARAEIVSIHAPVKGRPANPYYAVVNKGVSIHAPVKGRRVIVCEAMPTNVFQSTPP